MPVFEKKGKKFVLPQHYADETQMVWIRAAMRHAAKGQDKPDKTKPQFLIRDVKSCALLLETVATTT